MTTEKTIALTIWTFIDKVMSSFFKILSRFVIAFPTTCSDFRTQEEKICHCFHLSPLYLPWSDGTSDENPMNSFGTAKTIISYGAILSFKSSLKNISSKFESSPRNSISSASLSHLVIYFSPLPFLQCQERKQVHYPPLFISSKDFSASVY